MRRYLPVIFLAAGFFLVFNFGQRRIFSIDLPRYASEMLFFELRSEPLFQEGVMIFNTGKMTIGEIESEIDSLLMLEPKKIGINICHFNEREIATFKKFDNDRRVVVCNCSDGGEHSSAQIIDFADRVSHFKVDRPDYFEIEISDRWEVLKARDNELERIYYWHSLAGFQLNKDNYDPRVIKDRILLVGYLGDYITEELYDFESSRITQMNGYRDEYQAPDMYDVQISGIIVANIIDEKFIDEVNPLLRVLILLAFCLINAGVIIFVRTRWLMVNVFIYVSAVIVLAALGSFLILLIFEYNLYLHLNELTVLLIISSFSTLILSNMKRSGAELKRGDSSREAADNE